MRSANLFVLTLVLTVCSAASAQTTKFENLGRSATPDEIKAWDIAIGPAGKELPPGRGTAKEGTPIFAAKCAACHGQTGEDGGPLGPRIVGPKGTPVGVQVWPFTSTIWDFINRAMPRYNEGTLKPDEVYALTALLLYRIGVIKVDDVMDAKSLTEVRMPNRDGYVPSDLAEIGDVKKRACHLGHCPGPDPAGNH